MKYIDIDAALLSILISTGNGRFNPRDIVTSKYTAYIVSIPSDQIRQPSHLDLIQPML
jgi:hypothetical protein